MSTEMLVGSLLVLVALAVAGLIGIGFVLLSLSQKVAAAEHEARALRVAVDAARETAKGIGSVVEVVNSFHPEMKALRRDVGLLQMRGGFIGEEPNL